MIRCLFGDAILVPITEVGSLAVGVGWLSACVAYLARGRRDRSTLRHAQGRPEPGRGARSSGSPRAESRGDGRFDESPLMAWLGAAVSVAIILMKAVPSVPGSFTGAEWTAFVAWSALGLIFWLARTK